MCVDQTIVIEARKGRGVELRAGWIARIVNTHGSQVLDTWAFPLSDPLEFMSMEHTRSWNSRLTPIVGDKLVSNKYRPLLEVIEDTSPGVHDTLMCCCSKGIYSRMGHPDHDNCEDNLHAVLRAVGRDMPFTPGPLNLFMNFPVDADGSIDRVPPVSRAGDYVALKALVDILLVFSACPQDLSPVNGTLRRPTDAHCIVIKETVS